MKSPADMKVIQIDIANACAKASLGFPRGLTHPISTNPIAVARPQRTTP